VLPPFEDEEEPRPLPELEEELEPEDPEELPEPEDPDDDPELPELDEPDEEDPLLEPPLLELPPPLPPPPPPPLRFHKSEVSNVSALASASRTITSVLIGCGKARDGVLAKSRMATTKWTLIFPAYPRLTK